MSLLTGWGFEKLSLGQQKEPDWGEGNYKAARGAEDALDSEEAAELETAEAEGRSHARK